MFIKRLRCRSIISFYNRRGQTSVIHNRHNSSINLLEQWTNDRSTFSALLARGTTDRRHQDPPAIAGNPVAIYGIGGNPVAGYILPAILLTATVKILSNTRDCCMFQ
jgi:hypothetical protein